MCSRLLKSHLLEIEISWPMCLPVAVAREGIAAKRANLLREIQDFRLFINIFLISFLTILPVFHNKHNCESGNLVKSRGREKSTDLIRWEHDFDHSQISGTLVTDNNDCPNGTEIDFSIRCILGITCSSQMRVKPD